MRKPASLLVAALLGALSLLLPTACSRDVLPSRLSSAAPVKKAVLVQMDGVTPALLDLYLRSAPSRQAGRALARFLSPGLPDGSALTFATGTIHTCRVPLPGLPETSAGVLLAGRPAAVLGLRDPGDALAADVPTLLSAVPGAIGVGFPNLPGLDDNDSARADLVRSALERAGRDKPSLVVVRLSGVADMLAAEGLHKGPAALGQADEALGRMLGDIYSPEDTLLVVTSGVGATSPATQPPVKPGELARSLGLKLEQVVPTGGLLRVRALATEKVPLLAALPATELLLKRVGDALQAWDADLVRTRSLLDDEVPGAETRARLLAFLQPEEWLAVARRREGFEFRRVGEDPARVATGGLSEEEFVVPVVFAGIVPVVASRVVRLEAIAPAILTLLGRDARPLGSPPDVVTEASELAAISRRVPGQPRVDRGRLVLESDAFSDVEGALTGAWLIRRRTLVDGEPLSGLALEAVVRENRGLVQADQIIVDTSLFAAWGGPTRAAFPLSGLDLPSTAGRIQAAVSLADGLRALRGGLFAEASRRLAQATDLPTEIAPWHAAFAYWAARAAVDSGSKVPAPSPPALSGPDAAWLSGLVAAFELLSPATGDTEAETMARAARLPAAEGSAPRSAFAAALRALFEPLTSDTCQPPSELARRDVLQRATAAFVASGELGLSALARQRLLPQRDAAASALHGLATELGDPAAGWARAQVARGVLTSANLGLVRFRPEDGAAVEAGLRALSRLLLLKLALEVVSDREPGYEVRNADRVATLLDGSGSREPGLQSQLIGLAIEGRPELQGQVVAALLSKGIDLTALLSGQGATALVKLERLLETAASAVPGADPPTPEARLTGALVDALLFAGGLLGGAPAPPPLSVDDGLDTLDLVKLRNEALAGLPEDAPVPLVAWGPFIHLLVKAEVGFAAALNEGPAAARPKLKEIVALLVRVAHGEAARAGLEARLAGRIDALGAVLDGAVSAEPGAEWAALSKAALNLDLAAPGPEGRIVDHALSLAALITRDVAYAHGLAADGTGGDPLLLKGGSTLTGALMALAEAPETPTTWRYITLLLHGAQAALEDAPKFWAEPSPRAVLDRSPSARAALREIEKRLRVGLSEADVAAGLKADDVGLALRDLLVFGLSNLDAILGSGKGATGAKGAKSADGQEVAKLWLAHLARRIDQVGPVATAPGQGAKVRTLLNYLFMGLAARAPDEAAVLARLDAAEKGVEGTPYAGNGWVFPVDAFYVQLNAGHREAALKSLDRAAALCPGRAWEFALAKSWAGPTAEARAHADAYMREARLRQTGGHEIAFSIHLQRGRDLYQVDTSQVLASVLTGKSAGSFQLGAGASTVDGGESVRVEFGSRLAGTPRAAAWRARLVLAWTALLAGDDTLADAALGGLLQVFDGADPAIFLAPGPEAAALEPLPAPTEPAQAPLMLAWVLTLAEARGHGPLADALWARFRGLVGPGGVEALTSGTDLPAVEICGEVKAGDADSVRCHAPKLAQLTLGKPEAVAAVAALVAASVDRTLAPEGKAANTKKLRATLIAASKAAPTVLPPWTRGFYDVRAGLGKLDAKAGVSAFAAASLKAADLGAASREGLKALHDAGGVCQAAILALTANASVPDPEAIATACGAGQMYTVARMANPQGQPAEIVAGTARGLAATRWLGGGRPDASGFTRSMVEQAQRVFFVGLDDIRAATIEQMPTLLLVARQVNAPDLELNLRAFRLAWSLAHGSPPVEGPAPILLAARAGGAGSLPATLFLKRLEFDAGADAKTLALAHLAAPLGAAPSGTAPLGAAPSGTAPLGAAPSGTAPLGAAPSGTAPLGAAPSGTAPSGTAPSGTAPSGTAPFGAAPSGTAPLGVGDGAAAPQGHP